MVRHWKAWLILGSALGLALSLVMEPVVSYAISQIHAPATPEDTVGYGFTYQGRLRREAEPVTAVCDMDFLLYDSADGNHQVGDTLSASVPVTAGLFNATLDFGGKVFSQGQALWLQVQVECPGDEKATKLPLQALTATPYAIFAKHTPWDGLVELPAGFADDVDGIEYANVTVVAKSGGDFASIQAAIDAADNASATEPMLVWVAPGVYAESVTLRPHVHLRGTGANLTVISSTVSSSSWPDVTAATLVLTRETTAAQITVINQGTGSYNIGLLAGPGVTATRVSDVIVWAGDSSGSYRGVVVSGPDATLRLDNVTATAEGGSYDYGLTVRNGGIVTANGGTYTGRGGANICRGIYATGGSTWITAQSVSSRGDVCAMYNYGLDNYDGAAVDAQEGTFSGRGGTHARGVYNALDAQMDGERLTLQAGGASDSAIGAYNRSGGQMHLRGGTVQATGGVEAWAVRNSDAASQMTMDDVETRADGGTSETVGVQNDTGATIRLRNGTLAAAGETTSLGLRNDASETVARGIVITVSGVSNGYGVWNMSGGTLSLTEASVESHGEEDSWAIVNTGGTFGGSGSSVEATNVTALAIDGQQSFAVVNDNGAQTTLRHCSLTADHGTASDGYVYGISNYHGLGSGSIATVIGEELTVRAEGSGSSQCSAAHNWGGGTVVLRGGTYVAHDGWHNHALHNSGDPPGSVLIATDVTAISEGIPVHGYAVYNGSAATLANIQHSHLVGDSYSVVRTAGIVSVTLSTLQRPISGTVTCVGVVRDGSFQATGCP